MRRKFWPLLLIFAGIGLLLAYFLLFRGIPEAVNSEQTSSAELMPSLEPRSESQPPATAKLSPTVQELHTVESVPLEPTQTPQPVVPTRILAVTQATVEPTENQQTVESEAVTNTTPCKIQNCLTRFGTSGRQEQISAAHSAGLPFGVYLTWYTEPSPPILQDVQFWQMVNINAAGPVQSAAMIEEVIAANPGAVWIVGNEPDVVWQDNVTAERYAEIYHDVYSMIGTSGRQEQIAAAHSAGLPFGVYLTWYTEPSPPILQDVQFWQMVNINAAGPVQSAAMIEEAIAANPGAVWIVGNEPDVVWQDNVTAQRYAEIYHDVYSMIKQQDPTAQVAIAGVAQPTPMRLSYLDKVIETYQALYNEPLPVDIWTIHAFILREEADSWGVGIPPGLDELKGELYEIEDHNNIEVFGQNLAVFRAWMAERGYAEKPLAVTEFGILHPSDYGFPPEVVADFMTGAFDFFMTATNDTGYPADDYRLVQWWFWYSVYDGGDFPTGNLYDPELDTLTSAGKTYSAYVKGER